MRGFISHEWGCTMNGHPALLAIIYRQRSSTRDAIPRSCQTAKSRYTHAASTNRPRPQWSPDTYAPTSDHTNVPPPDDPDPWTETPSQSPTHTKAALAAQHQDSSYRPMSAPKAPASRSSRSSPPHTNTPARPTPWPTSNPHPPHPPHKRPRYTQAPPEPKAIS